MPTLHRLHRTVPVLLAILLAVLLATGSLPLGAEPAAAADTGPTLPQTAVARTAAQWLARQLTAQGFIPTPGAPTQADLSSTANTVLALASSGTGAIPGRDGAGLP